MFKAELKTKWKLTAGVVHVAKGKHGSLLIYKMASELDIIYINVNAVKCNEQQLTIDQLMKEYLQLFMGIGNIIRYDYTLTRV